MQKRHVINANYYCIRGSGENQVHVLNAGAYFLGEYSDATGEMKWHRVIPAEQRSFIERWLGQHFPATAHA
jgi:hypothetical protein